jgi:hypothetical protein
MTLAYFRHPYRLPPNCPRHPLHDEPCLLCAGEQIEKTIREKLNALEDKSDTEQNLQTEDIHSRDVEASRTREDAGEPRLQDS